MQTFLPYPDYLKSAHVLDIRRLGKQRVEAWQILQVLLGKTRGWRNHPAVRMWRGYEVALAAYGADICTAWIERGYKDSIRARFRRWIRGRSGLVNPPWFGSPEFHAAHRSNLLRKDPAYYGRFRWSEPSDLPYVWPLEASK